MKAESNNRKRLMGYFGVAVTTLLTPGGKLFTSAMAAATVVAGIAMMAKDAPKSTNKSSTPTIAQTSTPLINGAELLGLTDIPASESGYDPLTATASSVPVSNNAVLSLSTFQPSATGGAGMPAVNIPAPTIPLSNGVPVIVMGNGVPQLPGSDNPPVKPDEQPGIPEIPALPDARGPEIITEPDDQPNSPTDPEIIIAKAFPDSDPLKGPDVLPLSPPPRDDANNPLIADLALPSIQALVPTAVSLPSTLALLLLGLANFGWITRRRAMQM